MLKTSISLPVRSPILHGMLWFALLGILTLSGCGVVDSAGEGLNQAPVVDVPPPGAGDPGTGDGPGLPAADIVGREQDKVVLSATVQDDFDLISSYRWEQIPATPVNMGTAGATAGDPADGIVLQNADQPQAFFVAPQVVVPTVYRFRLTVTDNFGATGQAEVTVLVMSIAVQDGFSAPEDSSANVLDVLKNDQVAASGNLREITNVGTPDKGGAVVINGAGDGNTLRYTPAPDFVGTETFSYTMKDAEGKVDTTWAQVKVNNVNDPPSIVPPGKQFDAAGKPIAPLVIGVADADIGVDPGESLVFTVAGLPNGLSLAPSTGTVTGTPTNPGDFSVTVVVTDAAGAQAATVFEWNVSNNPPTAVDDVNSVTEDDAVNTATGDVRSNDFDGEDAVTALRIVRFGSSSTPGTIAGVFGNLTWAGNGQYTYALDNARRRTNALPAGASAADTFEYAVVDTDGGGDNAVLNITVRGANDVPTAVDDSATVSEDTSGHVLNVLSNDLDPDRGDTRRITSVGVPDQGGQAILLGSGANNSLGYAPAPDFSGTEKFSYTMADALGATSTATVTVTVTNVNDPPVAVDDTFSVDEDSTGNLLDVLANDTDVDPGDSRFIISVGVPDAGGAVTVSGAGPGNRLSYTPAGDFTGTEIFTYTMRDALGEESSAKVTVNVAGINDPPTISAIADQTTPEDTPIGPIPFTVDDAETPAGLLAVAATSSNVALVPGVTVSGGGPNLGISATPSPNMFGSTTITVTVTDQDGASTSTAFQLSVIAVNDPPVITSPGNQANPAGIAIAPLAVTAGDVDVGDTLVFGAAGLPPGLDIDAASGVISGTPVAAGSYGVSVSVTDAAGAGATAGFSWQITNNAPTANPDAASLTEDAASDAVTGNLRANDTDSGAPVSELSVTAVNGSRSSHAAGTYGLLSWAPDGNYTYSLDNADPDTDALAAGQQVTEVFTYVVSDAQGQTDTSTLTITITGANDAPVLNGAISNASAIEDQAFSLAFSASTFRDPDSGDSLAYTATLSSGGALPSWLRFDGATRSFSGIPATSADAGALGIRVTARDSGGQTATGDFIINVTAVNDAPTTSGLGDVSVSAGTASSNVDLAAGFDDEEDGAAGLSYAVTGNTNPALLTTGVSGSQLTLSYVAGVSGSADITIRATDTGSKSADATFTVTVSSLATLNAASDGGMCWTTPQARILRGSLSDGAEGPGTTYALVSDGRKGGVTITDPDTGAFEYVPHPSGPRGADTFIYRVTDPVNGTRDRVATVIVRQKVLLLGDDITAGFTDGAASLPPAGERVGYRKALYEALLQDGYEVDLVGSLSAGWSAAGFDADHEGHAGWSAYDIAYGSPATGAGGVFAWLEANPADVILLHAGTYKLSGSAADVGAVLDEVDRWEGSQGGNPVTVLVARIIDRDPPNPQVSIFNDDLSALVSRRMTDVLDPAYPDRLVLVDQHGALVYPQDLNDGVHPTQDGYDKMAAAWYRALEASGPGILDRCP